VCAILPILVTAVLIRPLMANPLDRRTLDDQTRQEAVAAIPFDSLTEEARGKLWSVVSDPSIYRRLPATVIDTDPELYLFLIRHPEVVVNIWDLMGVTKVSMQRTGDYTFDASDGSGTESRVELVYGDRETHVYYAEGAYEGALFRNLIRGRCVLVLHSEYYTTIDHRVYATNRLDMFVQLDNVGAELLAKTLHPLVGKSADHNFVESTRFLGQVSRASEAKGTKMQQLAERLTKIQPEVRAEFSDILAQVSSRAAIREDVQLAGISDLETPVDSSDRTATDMEEAGNPLDPLRDSRAHPRPQLQLRR
jgi:hypothetical protein